jgi:uncharacterized protein YsxB (DUF464 family)
MIKVAAATTGKNLALKVEGHAGYAKMGEDIVCASASILAYTVAQCVMEAELEGNLVAPPQIVLDGGEAFILCEPTEDSLPGMENIFAFARKGFELLAHNYPQYVRLMP